MTIISTTEEFKAFSCNAHKCTSDEMIALDITDRSRVVRVVSHSELALRRAREKDRTFAGTWGVFIAHRGVKT